MNIAPAAAPDATTHPTHTSRRPASFWRRTAGIACLGLAGALAGCGGGIYIGIDGSDDDGPPDVDLVVSPRAGFPGERIDLAAAASDDFAVRRVEFYRSDRGNVVFLGSDFAPPYGLQTSVPFTPAFEVSYLARAIDDVGQVTDSAWVVVDVLP